MTTRRQFLYSAALAATAGTLTACTQRYSGTARPDPSARPSTSTSGPSSETVTLGVAEYEPWAYAGDDGELTGQVVEVCRAVLARFDDLDLEVELLPFEALLPALTAERVDIVGGMGVLPERCAQADWSLPDHVSYSALVVPKGNPKGLKTFAEVAASGAVVALIVDTIEQDYATQAGVPAGNLRQVNSPENVLEAVARGEADCGAYDDITLRNKVRTGSHESNLDVLPGFTPSGMEPWISAFAFRKGDSSLREPFAKALSELQESGEWLEIAEKFDFVEQNLPEADISVDDACGR